MPSDVIFRTLVPGDIPFAQELKNLAGWNQTERDWLGYLEYEPEGCWVAEAGGRPAGTATTVCYDGAVGWIGMVLVHPERRRLGIGTQLLRHAIGYLRQRRIPSIKLDATPMGKKVYVPLGFQDEYEVTRFEGTIRPEDSPMPGSVRPLTPGDREAVAKFDAPRFGVERARVLASLAQRNPECCCVARDADGLAGYLVAREGQGAIQLGPWVARDAATAADLLRVFFRRIPGRRVLVDVPGPNRAGHEMIAAAGFTVQRGFTRMFLGENHRPGLPHQIYGTGGAEKG